MKIRLKDQEKHKIEKPLEGTLRRRPYSKVNNSTHRTQIRYKLILDETRLKEKSNDINYSSIGLKMK